jgi:transposase InsO family protein
VSQLWDASEEDSQWHPVAFWSRKFNDAEKNYETYDQELLAIVDAFKHWRQYFEGAAHTVQVLSDHNNLKGFMKVKELNGRQARWATFLAQFDFEVEHRSGKTNPADAPSRRPDYEESGPTQAHLLPSLQAKLALWHGNDKPPAICQVCVTGTADAHRARGEGAHVCNSQAACMSLHPFAREGISSMLRIAAVALTTAEHPYDEVSAPVTDAIRRLQATDDNLKTLRPSWKLEMKNDLWFRGEALYVPPDNTLRAQVLRMHHDSEYAGHFGHAKTLELLSRKYWWPRLSSDVKEYVQTCGVCQRTKHRRHAPYGELKSLPIPKGPFQQLSMDFITDLPPSMRDACVYDAILVIVDRYTKMAIYVPCNKTCTSDTLADMLVRHVVHRFGVPEGIVTDRGSVFTSDYWANFCYAARVTRRLSTAFHPQTDGQTERQNQVLEQYLRCFCSDKQSDWATWLPAAEFASNNSVSSTTRMSPHFALMGYHPSIHEPAVRGEQPGEEVPDAQERIKRLHAEREAATQHWRNAQEQQAKYHNERRTAHSFKVGDLVLLSTKNLKLRLPTRKMAPRFEGPFRVLAAIGAQAYRLALPKEYSRIHNVFHVSLLEPWHDRDDDGMAAERMPIALEVDGEEEYEVEKILSARGRKGAQQYLVKWKGYPENYDQWEPEENLQNAEELVREYWTSAKRRRIA